MNPNLKLLMIRGAIASLSAEERATVEALSERIRAIIAEDRKPAEVAVMLVAMEVAAEPQP